jgi:folate-dependent phosphoribosylglycinamide formyltransferase PurN
MENLSDKIAYITINPQGKFLKSAQLGFDAVGLRPKYLLYVSPQNRLLAEFKKHRLGLFHRFLWPKIKQHLGNQKSFSNEPVHIEIPKTFKIADLNGDKTAALIQALGIKYLVNCGAGIFRKKIIQVPGLTIINAHAGKLPEYRNMNVVEWALYMNEPVIGTIHTIDQGIDTGAILHQEELQIRQAKNYEEAREMAFDQVIRLAGKTVLRHAQGQVRPTPQDSALGKNWYRMHSYFHKKINHILAQNRLSP